jgi:hypothetical protein
VRQVAEARQEEVVQAADERQLPWPWPLVAGEAPVALCVRMCCSS